MDSIKAFLEITKDSLTGETTIDNLSYLGKKTDDPHVRLLWMFPDVLSLHGGRGDIMALLRFATAAGIPLEIRRIEALGDKIRLKKADMLYFCCGDLACAPDIIRALRPMKAELEEFAKAGKVIIANGSSGAILAKSLTRTDGTVVEGLGLLGMDWIERTRVHGDDLWLSAMDGVEVIGNEIRLADITLQEDQAPFAEVRYGRGNCGDGKEGARTNNVIYTGCLGPVLVRNSLLAMEYLRLGAAAAGVYVDPLRFLPDPDDTDVETKGIQESRAFIQKKLNAEKEKEKKGLKGFLNG